MYPSHLPHTLLVPSGFELVGVLAQRAVPHALRVPRVAALPPASFRPRLAATPLPSA